MRAFLILPFILLAGCGGGTAENIAFTRVDGRVVSVKASCEIVPPAEDGEEPAATKAGDCNQIIPESRKLEHREASAKRKLEVTFVFTSPVDKQLHQVTSEVRREISSRVPRPGDSIEVMAHPEQAAVATLP